MVRNIYSFVLLLLVFAISCKSPGPAVDFVEPEQRKNWQKEVEAGNVAFYDDRKKIMAHIDEPPRVKGEKSFERAIKVSGNCFKYAINSEGRSVNGKVEFLIDTEGKVSNFYLLKSLNKCNKTVFRSLKKATLHTGYKNGEPMPTLVHLNILLRFKMKIKEVSTY